MNTCNKIATLALVTLLASCAATGPANDGFDLSQESIDIGSFLGDNALEFTVDRPIDKLTDRLAATKQ